MLFKYKNDQLQFNGKNLSDHFSDYQGPTYVYDLSLIRSRSEEMKSSFPGPIQYAMKANSDPSILKVIKECGLGLDVVSGGELQIGLDAGFEGREIVFSGVGKTKKEIEMAISNDLLSINVECFQELERIAEIASLMGRRASVSLRVNPDVNAKTHRHITTGLNENKFGIPNFEWKSCLELLKKRQEVLNLVGITFHLGSQIQSLRPFESAIKKVFKLIDSMGSFPIKHLSVGGGLAIRYKNEKAITPKEFGSFIKKQFRNKDLIPMCEPGRALVGEAGVLLAEVQYIKKTGRKTFAILDTGMHHLMRPALYGAYHEILPLQRRRGKMHRYDFVGPICESTDIIGVNRKLPELRSGDKVVIANVGAYGYVMANHYNSHPLPQVICLP